MAQLSSPHRSLWLEQVLGDAADAPQFRGNGKADVAIIGGGFVGLWTAIRIKQQEPDCDVAVLEQDICGGGASGRNGGFVLSWWPKLASLARLAGLDEAIRIARGSEAAIDEIGCFCRDNKIDADFRKGGWLWTATSSAQMGAWESVVGLCERKGVTPFRRLQPEEVASMAGSSAHRAGVFEASAAVVQPAALVRGLRRAAIELGVRVFEGTAVQTFERTRPVVLRMAEGTLTADRLVVAANAWSIRFRELSRSLAVISSDIVATAPIPARLESIGWGRDLSITDSQTMVDYYRISREGRIVFGKGGGRLAYGGNIGASFDRDQARKVDVMADLRRYYPSLSDVVVTHDWSGPIDRTPDSLPILGRLGGRENIFYGVGWSGNGVGPSSIGGKILASLALGRKDEWSGHPLVDRAAASFPPEPIRYFGGTLIREAVARRERAEIRDAKPAWLYVQLGKLSPAGLEDKE
jgi:putative aminophosphonate oxidoreductase